MHVIKRSSPSNTKDSDRPAYWKITSNWSNISLIRKYLTLKWIFAELTRQEYNFLVDTLNPKFDMFMIANKLFFETKSKQKVQEIFNKYYTSNKAKDAYNILVYKFLRSKIEKSLKLEIFHSSRRKGIKYSGWRRHQNDQGSLGPNVEKHFQLLIPQEEENLEQKLFQTLLSVFESQKASEYLRLKSPNKDETEILVLICETNREVKYHEDI